MRWPSFHGVPFSRLDPFNALAGPIRYDGVRHDKPWIGSGRMEADPLDLRWALAIYVQACLLLWLVAGLQALFAGDMI